jgi:hypothetical protein
MVSDSCLVRVVGFDARGNAAFDQSESLFTITDGTEPAVQVLTPNGGEAWNAGDDETITWLASDLFGVDSVDIYYSTDNGGSWTLVAEGMANDSSHLWTVPATPSDSCLVRVRGYDPNDNVGSDTSDSLFSITVVGVREGAFERRVPRSLGLSLVNRNPFRGSAVLKLALPEAGYVNLDVYGVTGRIRGSIFVGELAAGYHLVEWNASAVDGTKLPGGVYFFRLETSRETRVAKGLLVD